MLIRLTCLMLILNSGTGNIDYTIAQSLPLPLSERTTFYVATNGNDNNPGTMDKPWATWQKGFNMAGAGDTVFIRGGIYYANTMDPYGVYISNKKGTKSKPIHIFNYPTEYPVLNCSTIAKSRQDNVGIRLDYCSYFQLKGLTITRVSQHSYNTGPCGFLIEHGGVFKLENCVANNVEGAGFQGYAVDTVELINCDSYNNYDISTTGYKGGQADGFVFCFASRDSYTTFKGCRAWNNSDDGFDCWKNEGVVIFNQCWAINNGRGNGDGGGFKLGSTNQDPMDDPQRILTNCLAVSNRFIGFNQNDGKVNMVFYNNIAYNNKDTGYSLGQFHIKLVIKNNISYRNGGRDYFSSNADNTNNSWNKNMEIAINKEDFISLDTTGIMGKRQLNGDLPKTNFLKLAVGSDLINRGVDVGSYFEGDAPDLGPFEWVTK